MYTERNLHLSCRPFHHAYFMSLPLPRHRNTQHFGHVLAVGLFPFLLFPPPERYHRPVRPMDPYCPVGYLSPPFALCLPIFFMDTQSQQPFHNRQHFWQPGHAIHLFGFPASMLLSHPQKENIPVRPACPHTPLVCPLASPNGPHSLYFNHCVLCRRPVQTAFKNTIGL